MLNLFCMNSQTNPTNFIYDFASESDNWNGLQRYICYVKPVTIYLMLLELRF